LSSISSRPGTPRVSNSASREALARSEAAREAAEDAIHRADYLAEASRVLSRSLNLDDTIAAVESVLGEIGGSELPVELVLNKIDAVDTLRRRRLANRFPDAVQISALTGEGVEALRARIAQRFADRFEAVHLFLPYEEGGKLAELYALGAPIEEREDQADGVYVRARLPHRELRRFARYLVAEARSERARRAR